MTTLLDSLLSVLPVVLLFALGYGLQKLRFFTPSSIADMKKLVSHLALPALMFQAFSSIEIQASYMTLVVIIFFTCAFMVLMGRILAKPVGVPSPFFSFMMGGFEMGMLGYALFLSLYGQEHLGKMALIDLGQVVFVFFVLMALLIKERDGVQSPWMLIRRFVTSPVIIAIFAGIVTSLVKDFVTAGALLKSLGSFIAMMASLTVPLIAITIGYGITIQRIGLINSIKTIAVRKILALVLFFIISNLVVDRLLGMPAMYRYAMMVMFLTPPPFIIAIFMKQEDKKNADYVANTLSLDTVVSIVLIIAMSAFYR